MTFHPQVLYSPQNVFVTIKASGVLSPVYFTLSTFVIIGPKFMIPNFKTAAATYDVILKFDTAALNLFSVIILKNVLMHPQRFYL